MRYRFIRNHQGQFRVGPMCRVLSVSRSGFYSWMDDEPNARVTSDEDLLGSIIRIHKESGETYGSRRIHKKLRQDGRSCGKGRVVRLMNRHGIRPKTRRKFRVTTDSRHNLPVAQNLLAREFSVQAPNQAWVCDITYIQTLEGWLYLSAVVDLYSRKVVGWSMGERINRHLVMDALSMAISARRPGVGLIAHSDRGSQYASGDYQKLLCDSGMRCSMSRKGDPWDNAVAESFFGSLKTERIRDHIYPNREAARRDIFEYIEVFYNRVRLHSTLGYLSPAQFESTIAAKAA